MTQYWVYENWIRNKAIVHRGECGSCNQGSGIHGARTTKSSTWHGPFESSSLALAQAKLYKRERTEGCKHCVPL